MSLVVKKMVVEELMVLGLEKRVNIFSIINNNILLVHHLSWL